MRKDALYPIFLVYFLDNFSFAVVFPLFSTLILTTQFDIIALTENLSARTALLGALNAAFPLALLIGAPIMGNLSDHYGRKRTFLMTVSATVLGNIATAIAISLQSYVLLLLSRFFCGFFSGNLTLCLATISDLSLNNKTRAKNFGSLTAVGGLSWVLAMLAGGELSMNTINPNFSPALPFWITAGIGLLNLWILYSLFPETHQIKKHLKLRLKPIFLQIFTAFETPYLRPLFIVQGLFLFSWLFIFQWFSGYSVARYGMPRDITAISLSLLGTFWILGATLLNRRLVQSIPLKKIPFYGLLLLTLLLLANSAVSHYLPLVAIDCLIAVISSITFANLFNLISFTARESFQGKVLGLSQSVMTLAQFAAPLVGSFIPLQDVPLLYRISAAAALLSLLFYSIQLRRLHAA